MIILLPFGLLLGKLRFRRRELPMGTGRTRPLPDSHPASDACSVCSAHLVSPPSSSHLPSPRPTCGFWERASWHSVSLSSSEPSCHSLRTHPSSLEAARIWKHLKRADHWEGFRGRKTPCLPLRSLHSCLQSQQIHCQLLAVNNTWAPL